MSTQTTQTKPKTAKQNTQSPTVTPKPRPRSKSIYPPLPTDPDAFCRLPQILEFLGMGSSTFYILLKQSKIPKPQKCGRSSYWKVGAIREAAKKLMKDGE